MMKVLYVFSTGPYSTAHGQEGLDAMLMGASFELEVAGLFLHDGVFQLKLGQALYDSSSKTLDNSSTKALDNSSTKALDNSSKASNHSGLKAYTKTYMALGDFGIEDIYVHANSLAARGLDQDKLMINTKVLDSKAIAKLIKQYDRVFNF